MTDDEGDASISQVETADFVDHSTASGESKRNGSSGRKVNGPEVCHFIPSISSDSHPAWITHLSSSFSFLSKQATEHNSYHVSCIMY